MERGREKRRSTEALPGKATPGSRRRGIWVMIGFSLVVFVVIVVFETRTELSRQQQEPAPEGAGAPAPAESAEPVTLIGRLKEHYRSHELPRGWTLAGIDAPTEAAATVRIVFSPSPQDPRYGRTAPAEDIEGGAFCPAVAKFWASLEDRTVSVELGDKDGALKTIACDVVLADH